MKMERLSQDKIRIFLTFDDLLERGIQKEDMWREIPKVQELLSDMMEQAYSELGFDASGPLAVEVFALPAQGMVVIVTRSRLQSEPDAAEAIDEEEEDDVYEMEVTLETSDTISYAFRDFEELLRAAKRIHNLDIEAGRLYAYKGHYILQIEPEDLPEDKYHALIALLSEYGDVASVTPAVLDEYGKTVMPERAIGRLNELF
ncbi:genetic competence negative regulator [Paenibacillus thermoaerophilus]|jgi:adapter protein MecA 1/2|uniref:Genetic competence negative regulator n=1 Tax=Paenibacillus thermoaerophilus TaxID=1215385 RepID=A0ABW2V5U4_9BACL|nr:genetic competence negative regulator [Paenibacillus thermoaerophilus]TMV18731.1 genetic competence negative regulator [Paenibacillus thermoaerophilus]